MKVFLPLALLIVAAQAQFIIGALALIQFTIEILEAAEVVATIDVSVEAGLVGAEASETATISAEVTSASTIVRRAREASVAMEGDASLTGFNIVASDGPGFVQGTFNYRPPYSLGVGAGRRASANPHVTLGFNARTNAVRSGPTTRINFNNPYLNNVRITNPGGAGTTVRIKGHPFTKFLADH